MTNQIQYSSFFFQSGDIMEFVLIKLVELFIIGKFIADKPHEATAKVENLSLPLINLLLNYSL